MSRTRRRRADPDPTRQPAPSPDETRRRRGYLDWMRGLGVVVMIEAHVIDSWTRLPDRLTPPFQWAIIVGGFGAPLFLFLAGISVALSAGSKLRRSGDVRSAAAAVMRRGLWIFLLAFVFRVQAWILGLGAPSGLLKVDILNIMGPGIMAAAALWGAFRSPRGRAIGFAAAALAFALAAPFLWAAPWLDAWPEPLVSYLRPTQGRSNFSLFPWVGFVFAGGLVGVLIDETRTAGAEAAINVRLLVWGAAVSAAALLAARLPGAYAGSDFWGASPAFFLLRAGVITLVIGLAYVWDRRPRLGQSRGPGLTSDAAPHGWSPMLLLGRNSLFIYWIHVELVYGLISIPIHRRLSLPAAWAAFGAFAIFMVACAALRDRVAARRRSRRSTAVPALSRLRSHRRV